MIFGGDMPKANRYIIRNKVNGQYYKIDGSGIYYGKINEAWYFGGSDLEHQARRLVRENELYEIILMVNKDGSLTEIR